MIYLFSCFLTFVLMATNAFAINQAKEIELEERIKSEVIWSLERSEYGNELMGLSVDLIFSENTKTTADDISLTYAPPYLGKVLEEENVLVEKLRFKVIFSKQMGNEAQRQISEFLRESYSHYPVHISFAEKAMKAGSVKKPFGKKLESLSKAEKTSMLSTGAFVFLSAILLFAGFVFLAWVLKTASSSISSALAGLKFNLPPPPPAPQFINQNPEMQTVSVPQEPQIEFNPQIHLQPQMNMSPNIHVSIPKIEVIMPNSQSSKALEEWEQNSFEISKTKFLEFVELKPALTTRVLKAQGSSRLSIFKHFFKYVNKSQAQEVFKALGIQKRLFKRASGSERDEFPILVKTLCSIVDDLCMEEILSADQWKDVLNEASIKRLRSMSAEKLANEVKRVGDLRVLASLSDILLVGEFRSLVNELEDYPSFTEIDFSSVDETLGARLLLSILRPPVAANSKTYAINQRVIVESKADSTIKQLEKMSFDEEYEKLQYIHKYNKKLREEIRSKYWSLQDIESLPVSMLKDWFYTFDCHTLALLWKFSAGRCVKLQAVLNDYLLSSGEKNEVLDWAQSIQKYSGRSEELEYIKGLRKSIKQLRSGYATEQKQKSKSTRRNQSKAS